MYVIMDIMAKNANTSALRVAMTIFVTLLMVIAPKDAQVKSMAQSVIHLVIPTVTLATVTRTLVNVPAYQDFMGKTVIRNVHQTVTRRNFRQVMSIASAIKLQEIVHTGVSMGILRHIVRKNAMMVVWTMDVTRIVAIASAVSLEE